MFKFTSQLSVKSKLIIMLLVVSLGAALTIGYLGWRSSRTALQTASFNQLTSVRASKAYQIETYFQNMRNQVETLSKAESTAGAMVRFNRAFRQLDQTAVPSTWHETLDSYYENEFFPRLAPNISGEPTLAVYKPESQAGNYLQYYYIAANENPVGEKHLLDDAADGSEYSDVHHRYHPFFRELIEKFGYYDLFLIDYDTQEIIYSVFKEADYATSLADGPYFQSGLAEVVDKVRANPQVGAVQIVDFRTYAPSYEAPAAFIATPIHNGPHIVGILAIQLPVDEINRVVTGDQNWAADGLGESGETYLIGPDLSMRSVSRFLIEDLEGYLAALRAAGVSQSDIQKIEQFETSILLQKVDTAAARSAISGDTGTQVVNDYRDIPVLSAYQSLDLAGLDWAILTEMDLAEVNQPVNRLERNLLISITILVLVVTVIAIIASYIFVYPLNALIKGAQQVGTGQDMVRLTSGDEFSNLAETFGNIVTRIRQEAEAVEHEKHKNEAILKNVLPGAVIERMNREEQGLDEVQGVTVMFARVIGLTTLATQQGQEIHLLEELNQAFDDMAHKYDMDRIEIIGESFVAACGLTKPHLDHGKRTLDYVLSLSNILQRFNQHHDITLSLAAGIDSGTVTIGIMNTDHFGYDIWGKPLDFASDLLAAAPLNTILVTPAVYERRRDLYVFQPYGSVQLKDQTQLEAWHLVGPLRSLTEAGDTIKPDGTTKLDDGATPSPQPQTFGH